ncbi:N-acetyllactosaminide beta-1,3-N-acetylglucosaminyltransferase [Aphelenchoides fujianensis]|nr:N-acetyllactosaminide beta-1,3-N-acetylglucosaminyltransferase [Aphelenchoides fujianensis]
MIRSQSRSGILDEKPTFSLVSMVRTKSLRNVVLALCCVVGVLHIKQQLSNGQKTNVISPYQQEVSNIRVAKIRTMLDNGYCIAANVIQGEITEYERITLILHISNDRLDDRILTHVKNWDGPVSLSVAFPEQTTYNSTALKCAVDSLLELQAKHLEIRQKLSVHFLARNVSECSDFVLTTGHALGSVPERQVSVEECKPKKENLSADQLAEKFVQYPVNKARNVARKFATTKYILSADMDHLFSENFESRMISLAERTLDKDPKTVLVYRIFEVSKNAPRLPRTKEDLLELYIDGTAEEFHKYYGAHSIPRLYQWFRSADDGATTNIQFYRPYTSHHWEPQFVALNNIPEHDETFIYSTRDNTCLRWEMCRAGYKFAIVENVFMFHSGYKEVKEISLMTKARHIVGRKQNTIITNFNKRMDQMYNSTKKSCPRYEV